jgi:hypothetical protein
MQFDADLVIRYLTEVLKIEDPEDFPDNELLSLHRIAS